MDLEAAFAAMRERYEGWLAEHGAESARAVGWNDPAQQALVALRHGPPLPDFTVLARRAR